MWTDKINKKVHAVVFVLHHYDLYHETVEFNRIKKKNVCLWFCVVSVAVVKTSLKTVVSAQTSFP